MMEDYVRAAMARIEDFNAGTGKPSMGVTLTAIKVELQTMYTAGYTNALKSKENQKKIDQWIDPMTGNAPGNDPVDGVRDFTGRLVPRVAQNEDSKS